MKKFILISFLLFAFSACSGPEPNLQLSSPEAFAFDLGDSWEVNASIKAKNFSQLTSEEYVLKSGREIIKIKDGYVILDDKVKTKLLEDNYHNHIYFTVDLISPLSDTLKSIFNDTVSQSNSEEILDTMLEAQIEIDSTFGIGDYKLIFNVTDVLSKQTKSLSLDFNLSK